MKHIKVATSIHEKLSKWAHARSLNIQDAAENLINTAISASATRVDPDRCGAVHEHPYVVCKREKGHRGNHRGDNPEWQV